MSKRWDRSKLQTGPTLFDPQPAGGRQQAAGGAIESPTNYTAASQEAARKIERVVDSQLERVMDFIRSRRELGATNDEIAQALAIKIQSVCARRNTLAKTGKIIDSGRTRKTASGFSASVWIAKEFVNRG